VPGAVRDVDHVPVAYGVPRVVLEDAFRGRGLRGVLLDEPERRFAVDALVDVLGDELAEKAVEANASAAIQEDHQVVIGVGRPLFDEVARGRAVPTLRVRHRLVDEGCGGRAAAAARAASGSAAAARAAGGASCAASGSARAASGSARAA